MSVTNSNSLTFKVKQCFLVFVVLLFSSYTLRAQEYKKMMHDNTYNIYEVVRVAEDYFNSLTEEEKYAKGSGWKNYQRWLYENEPKYYPSGDRSNVDPYFLKKSFEKNKKEIPVYSRRNTSELNKIFNTGWEDLGPYTIEQVTGHYAVGLGRVESFYVNPNNDQQIYLGTRSGGFWKTSDGGNNWAVTTDFLIATGVNAIAVPPGNPNSILINVRNARNGTTHGIYRSSDAGNTWTESNFNPTNLGWGGLGSDRKIYTIKYHPTIANLVFVGTNNGLYRSTDDLTTWTRLQSSYNFIDVEFHPTDPNIIYAAASDADAVVFVSTDGGLTFSQTPVSGNTSNIHLSVSAACPDCVYVGTSDGIWKSSDKGNSFSFIGDHGLGNYGAFAVSDVDNTIILNGNIDTHMSTDEGLTFNKVTYWSQGNAGYATNTSYVHADIRGARSMDGVFWVNTDGFLGKSPDNGATWEIYEGMGIRENYSLGASQSNHYRTICGSQDNGTSIKTETGWIEFYGADGMEGIIHPLNDDWMIGSLQNGGRRRTKDGGITQGGVTPSGQTGAWVAPLAYDPNNPMTVYSFGENVYKSTDFGSNWINVGTPSFTGTISLAAIAENNSNTIVVSKGQNIEKSMDGGVTFSSIKSNLPNYSITDIAFDPNDDNVIIVTYNRYNNDGSKVYITTDQGQSWENITYNLNNMPVRAVVIDHTDDSTIYLGTEIGVYKKAMADTTWSLYSPELPNTTISELEIIRGSNTLRAVTWGRGLWEFALDGRESYPAILTTDINHAPTELQPKYGIDQYVTSTISYNNTLSNVFVEWSSESPTFSNVINMSNTQGDTWVSDSPIPTFVAGTKIYFRVVAVGSNGDRTETYKFMYTVKENNVNVQIASSWDDVEERISDGVIDENSSDIELGNDPGTNGDQTVGLLFRNVEIPQGATITSAHLEFTVDEIDTEVTSITIKGNNVGNAPDFSATVNDVTNRPVTTASVVWDIPEWNAVGNKHQSPDISSIVQEIVNRSDWTTSNKLAFIISGSGSRTVESYDGSSSNAARLYVEFESGSQNAFPNAGFTSNISDKTVDFSDTSTDSDGTIVSWLWDFGDGNTSTTQNPTHTYTSYSDYTVTLTVTDNDGGVNIATDTLTIASPDDNFAMLGDFGENDSDASDVANLVNSWNIGYVVTAGDNRYGSINFDQAIGNKYCQWLKDAGSGISCNGGMAPVNKFFPSPGNHDYDDGGGINEYLDYFTLPGTGVNSTNTSGNERYYDVIQGDIHFFMIDSDKAISDVTDRIAQQNWLQIQLRESTANWKVVVLHHAPYSSGNHGNNTTMQWPYAAWGADVVMAGHDHHYERIYKDDIYYIVNGLGGRSIYNVGTPISGSQFLYNEDYGALRVSVSGDEMNIKFINVTGAVIDDHTIIKDNTPPTSGLVVAQISASWDDVEERNSNGVIDENSSDIELGDDPGVNGDQTVGLLFRNIDIPEGGVIITSAYLEFIVDEVDTLATSITIKGNNIGNAPDFSATVNDVTSRTLTTTSVPWDIPAWNTVGNKHQSPDISSIVQEIVDRSDWAALNKLAFIIEGSGSRTAESFDGSPIKAAKLYIEFDILPPSGTVDAQISASWDDVEERNSNGNIDGTSSDIELGDDPGVNGDQTVGLLFRNIDIPKRRNITAAYLEFTVDEIDTLATSITIRGNNIGNAPDFSGTVNDVTNRPLTTASVAWNNISEWNTVGNKYQSPDISSIVQEIVDRSDWAALNKLAFIIEGSGSRTAESFDGASGSATRLHIEYDSNLQNLAPNADFTYTVSDKTVTLTDTSTDSDGTIASWSWDFGDGNTSTLQNPSHTYSFAGTYIVALTVIDNDNATHYTSKQITVPFGADKKKSLVIMLDGLRSDGIISANTPNMDALINGSFGGGDYKGGYAYYAQTIQDAATSSAYNHVSIMTGVNGTKHGVSSNDAAGISSVDYNTYPTYLYTLESNNPSLNTAYLVNWTPDLEMVTGADYVKQASDDANVGHVIEIINGTYSDTSGDQGTNWSLGTDVDVITLFINDIDATGHSNGFSPDVPAYITKIESVDVQIGQILAAIQNRSDFANENWQIVITTDHGGSGTGHGGLNPSSETIPFIISSKSTKQGFLTGRVINYDTAASAIEHMLESSAIPSHYDGVSQGHSVRTPAPSNLTDSLVVYLPFNGDTNDKSGLGNDAFIAPGSDHDPVTYSNGGKLGGYLEINDFGGGASNASYLTLGNPSDLDFGTDTSFTIATWFRAQSDQTGDPVILGNKNWISGSNIGTLLLANEGNGDDFGFNISDGIIRRDVEEIDYSYNEWWFQAVTVDRSGNAVMFIGNPNGNHMFVISDFSDTLNDITSSLPWNIGQDGTGSYEHNLDGDIDEMTIWRRALTLDEIRQLYNDGNGMVLNVPDTIPPVITLNGEAIINSELGNAYTDEGATATDNIDGDITGNITFGGDVVDVNTVGTYIVTYNVSDVAGNAATEVTRTINITCLDSDNDGICDDVDVCPGSDDTVDTDGDSIPDGCDDECSYTLIDFNNFDSSWGIWNDGGSDARRSANDAIYSNGGTGRSVRLRDNTFESVMTTDNLDLSSYEELTINFNYLTRSMDNSNEDFWLQISTDGGGTFTTVEEWNLGDEFTNDIREFDTVVVPGPFTSNTQLRFRCDASGNQDWVYIDDVEITGCTNSSSAENINSVATKGLMNDSSAKDIKVYPNPISEILYIGLNGYSQIDMQVEIYNIKGQKVLNQKLSEDVHQVNLRAMANGLYILVIKDQKNSTLMRKRIIVNHY